MKVFVTGGTGFIGRNLVQQLLDQNYEVTSLTPTDKDAASLSTIGATPVIGSINDAESMRAAMSASDIVFHCAGWDKIGTDDWMQAEVTNVAGTRTVLRLALELEIPRIIHTSSSAVFGDTRGQLVDETFVQGGPFISELARTKWLAHYKVAVPLIEQGAPITIVIPGFLYGPQDQSLIADLMRAFYGGKMPAVPGPEFTVSYVHVGDVSQGLILAAEQGQPGKSYIIAGPAIPLGEMVDFWAQITGRPAPKLHIPARFFKPFGPVFDVLRGIFKLPTLFSQEAIEMINITSMTRADKAKSELGWRSRSLHDGMTETFGWIEETTPERPKTTIEQRRKIAGIALLSAAIIFVIWLISRRRDNEV